MLATILIVIGIPVVAVLYALTYKAIKYIFSNTKKYK